MLKKRKINYKIIAFILTLLLTFLFISSMIYSNAVVDLVTGKYKKTGNEDAKLKDIAQTILGYIQAGGVAIFLGAIIVYGMNLVSGDSKNLAEIKEKFIMWMVAGLLIFGGTTIIEVILKISGQTFQN